MKFLTLFLALLFCFAPSFGQTKKIIPKPTKIETPIIVEKTEPIQTVIIEKMNGDRLTGLFVSGDVDSITINISGSQVKISLSEIANVNVNAKTVEKSETENRVIKPTLSIEAALVYSYGGAQPVARTTFYLLDESAEKILADAGMNTGRSQTSFVDTYAMATIYSLLPSQAKISAQGTAAITPHILEQTTTDFTGKATFEGLETRTYWIFAVVKTRSGYAVWNLEQSIIEGENKIILDQNNAKTAL